MRTADFDFALPPELIAQHPAPRRDESRLLVLHRGNGQVEHRRFRDVLEFFRAGDLLVLNNSRVIPARLRGRNARSGGQFEILLLEENAGNDWWAMLRPAKRARVGTQIVLHDANGSATNIHATGSRNQRGRPSAAAIFRHAGHQPRTRTARRSSPAALHHTERTQTNCAKTGNVTKPSLPGPTARSPRRRRDLHFTPELLQQIRDRGVQVCFVTLHVGAGTFLPVKYRGSCRASNARGAF